MLAHALVVRALNAHPDPIPPQNHLVYAILGGGCLEPHQTLPWDAM